MTRLNGLGAILALLVLVVDVVLLVIGQMPVREGVLFGALALAILV